MYGNGIGTLSILLSDTKENKEKILWSLSGEAGNAWYQAELPISSSNPFMVCCLTMQNFIFVMEQKSGKLNI